MGPFAPFLPVASIDEEALRFLGFSEKPLPLTVFCVTGAVAFGAGAGAGAMLEVARAWFPRPSGAGALEKILVQQYHMKKRLWMNLQLSVLATSRRQAACDVLRPSRGLVGSGLIWLAGPVGRHLALCVSGGGVLFLALNRVFSGTRHVYLFSVKLAVVSFWSFSLLLAQPCHNKKSKVWARRSFKL